MDERVVVTNIEIITAKKTEVLSKYKTKKFCAEKLQINIIKTTQNHCVKKIFNISSSINKEKNEQESEKINVKTGLKVCFIEDYI